MTPVEQYIRQRAAALGINPEYAIAAAHTEGGTEYWSLQSGLSYRGKREWSFGPFQLFYGYGGVVPGSGMGNAFQSASGLGPPNGPQDEAWGKAAIDYALQQIKAQGWATAIWHGFASLPFANTRQGIGGPATAPIPPSSTYDPATPASVIPGMGLPSTGDAAAAAASGLTSGVSNIIGPLAGILSKWLGLDVSADVLKPLLVDLAIGLAALLLIGAGAFGVANKAAGSDLGKAVKMAAEAAAV